MSAYAYYLTEKAFFIVSDTLTYTQKEGKIKEVNFKSKILHFPTLKTTVVSVGYYKLSVDLSKFIDKRVVTDNIESLVKLIKEHFLSNINLSEYQGDPHDDGGLGHFNLFGYSENEKRLMFYQLLIFRDRIDVCDQNIIPFNGESKFASHPLLSEESKIKLFSTGRDQDIRTLLQDVMMELYNDSLNSETFQVAIGGEVIFTALQSEPEYLCMYLTLMKFPNYIQAYNNCLSHTTGGPQGDSVYNK